MFWLRRLLILLVLLSPNAHAGQLRFGFDFENTRIVSAAISTGDFNLPSTFCTTADAKALIRKMRLKDCEALIGRYKILRDRPQVVDAAKALSIELSKPGYGKYAPLAAEVARQLREYVPADFHALLNVHFIFGSLSDGFAFGDTPDDVYVDMKGFSVANTQELAETVAHELFHAIQNHVMRHEALPTAAYAKNAIFDLLKQPPKQFLLRYQAIAQKQGKLPLFSPDFIQQVELLS